jgi:hypothetical protein
LTTTVAPGAVQHEQVQENTRPMLPESALTSMNVLFATPPSFGPFLAQLHRWLRRHKVPRMIFAIVLSLIAVPIARADVRIIASSGGLVGDYLKVFAQMRQSGERVIIDGPCLSACTLVLSTIPRNRICVTRRAVLGFHAPQWVDRSGHTWRAPKATRIVIDSYPAGVRAWIKARGGLSTKLIYLRGRELTALYPRC